MQDISDVLSLSFHLDNRVCLSHGVHVTGAVWRVATRIVGRVGELIQSTGDVLQVRYSVAG
jgi:hypothetical protein